MVVLLFLTMMLDNIFNSFLQLFVAVPYFTFFLLNFSLFSFSLLVEEKLFHAFSNSLNQF